ncbi:MAG: hypothetical protein HMLKMBBP_01328 [Planctomycetes bacterium]|nr:hypothetical protein [Planctomycetota bacterium]
MLVSIAENTTLIAAFGSPAMVYSQEFDTGQNNFAGLTVVVDQFLNMMAGAGSFDVIVQGSNDGRNWIDIPGFSVTAIGTGVSADSDSVPYAQVRLKYMLTVAGGAGAWSAVTFDAKLNLQQK